MLRRSSLAALLFGSLVLMGCPPPTTVDGGTDAGSDDAGTVDGGSKLKPCLDQPTDLPRPPGTSGLPCDLIPPGFAP